MLQSIMDLSVPRQPKNLHEVLVKIIAFPGVGQLATQK